MATHAGTMVYVAGEELASARRVKPGLTAGTVVYADAADGQDWIGVTLPDPLRPLIAAGNAVSVALRSGYATRLMESAGNIAAQAKCYAADDGKIAAAGEHVVGILGGSRAAVAGSLMPVHCISGVAAEGGGGNGIEPNPFFYADGPPASDLGVTRAVAIDPATSTFYGPKTVEGGWGEGVVLGSGAGGSSEFPNVPYDADMQSPVLTGEHYGSAIIASGTPVMGGVGLPAITADDVGKIIWVVFGAEQLGLYGYMTGLQQDELPSELMGYSSKAGDALLLQVAAFTPAAGENPAYGTWRVLAQKGTPSSLVGDITISGNLTVQGAIVGPHAVNLVTGMMGGIGLSMAGNGVYVLKGTENLAINLPEAKAENVGRWYVLVHQMGNHTATLTPYNSLIDGQATNTEMTADGDTMYIVCAKTANAAGEDPAVYEWVIVSKTLHGGLRTLESQVTDPGHEGTIDSLTGTVRLVAVNSSGDTRVLGAPTKAGQQLLLSFLGVAPGGVIVTCATKFDGSNNTCTFSEGTPGWLLLVSIAQGNAPTVYRWQVIGGTSGLLSDV